MIIALITLLTAMVLKLRFTEQRLTNGYIAALYVITFLIGQYKIVYVLFCLLVFAVPKEKFGSIKSYTVHAVLMGGMVACTSLINHLVLVAYLILFVYELTVIRQSNSKNDKTMIRLLSGCILGTVFLIYTAEFIQWNDGINIIGGVQGRYFLPFVFPLLLLIGGFEDENSAKISKAETIYLHGLVVLCFIPQILLKYLYCA